MSKLAGQWSEWNDAVGSGLKLLCTRPLVICCHLRCSTKYNGKGMEKLPLARGENQIGSDGWNDGVIIWWTPCTRSMVGPTTVNKIEQAEEGLIRVDLSSDSSSMTSKKTLRIKEDLSSPKEMRREDPPPPPSEDCDSFHQRLLRAAPAIEPLKLEANED